MIFQKEIQNEIEAKATLFGIGLPVVISVSAGFYWWKQQPTVLHIGVYAGSSWDVPPVNVPMPWILRFKI